MGPNACLAFVYLCMIHASPDLGAPVICPLQQPASQTYDQTEKMLRAWIENKDFGATADLARLFEQGRTRAADLLEACRSTDDRLAAAAYVILGFVDATGLRSCAQELERRHGGLFHSTGSGFSRADAGHLNQWLASKEKADGYRCGGIEDPEIDDALVYSLILDGSTISTSVLARIRAFAEACMGGDTLFLIRDAESLAASAKKIGHDLQVDGRVEESIRASAFFLPVESRGSCQVVVVARTNDRLLLSVRYSQGFFGGGIFFVVLRKAASTWQYATIRRWASF